MQKINQIPFNWDTYQSDKSKYTVVTRDGQSVSQLTKFDLINEPSVFYGVLDIKQHLYRWHENGLYYKHDEEYYLDLMLQYEEEWADNWVNVYKDGSFVSTGVTYPTKEQALQHKQNRGQNYFTTINLNDIVT